VENDGQAGWYTRRAIRLLRTNSSPVEQSTHDSRLRRCAEFGVTEANVGTSSGWVVCEYVPNPFGQFYGRSPVLVQNLTREYL
jgi:hypothetical protein